MRLKTQSKEQILQRLLGQSGLAKIYALFNTSKTSDVRKLAGRLICEALYSSTSNQDFFCSLFDLDCTYGRVSINQSLPIIIKQKLADEPDFLFSLHSQGFVPGEHSKQPQFHLKRYWSFPEFTEIQTAVLNQQRQHGERNRSSIHSSIDRSVTPSRSKEARINSETMLEYVNFPDPQLYMVGFCMTPTSDFSNRNSSQEASLHMSRTGASSTNTHAFNSDLVQIYEQSKPVQQLPELLSLAP